MWYFHSSLIFLYIECQLQKMNTQLDIPFIITTHKAGSMCNGCIESGFSSNCNRIIPIINFLQNYTSSGPNINLLKIESKLIWWSILHKYILCYNEWHVLLEVWTRRVRILYICTTENLITIYNIFWDYERFLLPFPKN